MLVRIIILLSLAVLPLSSNADNLSLRDTLAHIIKNHPGYKAILFAKKIAIQRQRSFAGENDWFLNFGLSYYDINFASDNPDYIQTKRNFASFALRKTFWELGGSLRVIHNTFKEDVELASTANEFLVGGQNYFSTLGVDIIIPMLKNIGGIQTRRNFDRQGFEIHISSLAEDERIEALLNEVSHYYINWNISIQLKLLSDNYIDKLKNLQQTPAPIGVAAQRYDYLITWALAEAVRIKSATEASAIAATNRLVEFTNIEPTRLVTQSELILPTNKSLNSLRPKIIDLDKLRTLRESSLRDAQISHTIKADQNNVKPQLDFVISNFISGGDENFKSAQHDDRELLSLRLIFQYPIGDTRGNARLSQSRMLKNRNVDSALSRKYRLKSLVESQYAQLSELKRSIELSRQEIKLADEVLNLELEELKKGKIDVSFYITALQNSYRQKQGLINYSANFQHRLLDYLSVIDKLWDGENLGGAI